MEKFKEIQNRLNNISVQEHATEAQQPNKLKARQLQSMISRLTSNFEQDDVTREYKLNEMLEKVRKIELTLKDSAQEAVIKQSNFQSKVIRVEKNIKKKMEKLNKLKKESDKDFQMSLHNYLIELAGFKSKMNHSCLSNISLLKQKQAQIEELHKTHTESTLLTKEILKKIYNQYSSQIEDLNRLIVEEDEQRKTEEDILLDRLEKVYEKISKGVGDIKKQREASEGEMIGLLEKVVERVRHEVVKM